MFVIYYKSKYSSDMFYCWKFSEMVHFGSVMMLVYFLCMFCLFKEPILGSRMFMISYKSKYSSDMFYDWKFSEMVHPGSALWLVCFLVFCVCFVCLKSIQICFFLRSRMSVIYYRSKYSSDMLYDWKFSEMVHPGTALMTGMFSCILCMFFFSKEHPDMFFPY